jgi:large repetitive protein
MLLSWIIILSLALDFFKRLTNYRLPMRKLLLLITTLLFSIIHLNATHVAGGYIDYQCTGNPNEYLVTVTLYRDCSGVEMPTELSNIGGSVFGIPIPAELTFDNDCGYTDHPAANSECGGFPPLIPGDPCFKMDLISVQEVSQLCETDINNSTCNGGSLPGYEEYIYQALIVLPPCDSWKLTYQLCCRNPATNVQNADAADFVIETVIYTQDNECNSTPKVTAAPQPYVCVNENITYNLGAYDADGDNIEFSLVQAMATPTNAVNYQGGYSATEPIPGITINPNTGVVNFTPTLVGNYIIVIQMNEYDDNGNLLSTINYDFQFTVQNCSNNPPTNDGNGIVNINGAAILDGPDEVSMCLGESTCFDVVFTDPDVNDVLEITTNLNNIFSNASMTLQGTNPVTATVCFDALDEEESNVVTFLIQDGACPIQGQNNYTIVVNSIICDGCFLNVNTNVVNCGDIEGTLSFLNQPESGQLIIENCFGQQIVYDAPFESGVAFLFDNMPSIPDECEITAWFTVQVDDEDCIGSTVVMFEDFAISLNVTPDITFYCPNDDDIDLFANASGGSQPYTFVWFDDANLTNQVGTGGTISVNPNDETTTYYVEVTGACGETSVESVTITFDLTSELTLIYQEEYAVDCFGNDVTITLDDVQGGSEPFNIVWQDESGTVIGTDVYQVVVDPTPAIYTVTVTDECGSVTTGEITIVLLDYEDVEVNLDDEYVINCPGDGITLEAEASLGQEPYSYEWSTGETTSSIIVSPQDETQYSVTVTDACGSSATAFTTVTLVEHPPLIAEVEDIVTCPETMVQVEFDVSGGYGSLFYNWLNVEGVVMNDNVGNIFMGEESGTFNILISDQCGDNVFLVLEIEVVNCEIEIPNIITPNGDGVNDAFHISNLEFHPNTELRIFNRWGNLVYESDNYDNNWRGTKTNGTDLSDGTYFYILTLSTTLEVFQGAVTVKR